MLARVESKAFSSNPAVVVEYLKALVATERLNEYADHPSAASASSSSTSSTRGSLVGVGALPAPGQDHRSLLALLKELQGLAGGGPGASGSEAPGSSLRRPLHVVLQVSAHVFWLWLRFNCLGRCGGVTGWQGVVGAQERRGAACAACELQVSKRSGGGGMQQQEVMIGVQYVCVCGQRWGSMAVWTVLAAVWAWRVQWWQCGDKQSMQAGHI